jgi:Asp-tRNA(Asn)/Glu-tRNA(Gln) amidotransferase A subunit family amidase
VAGTTVSPTGVRSIAAAVACGAMTSAEVLESFLVRIAAVEPAVAAFSVLDEASARRQAEALDAEAANGRWRGPLHGVPVAVKDEFDVAGLPTALRGADSPAVAADAACVQRLRAAGAVIVGKTTMPLAGRVPPTRNPWNLGHTPGGTSSGSAAAVSARMVPFAIAEQTAGSTLRPAAYCGVDGFKPSYGAISRFGCYPFTWSRDHVGLIGLSAADIALVFDVIAGPDPRDPTTLPRPAPSAAGDPGHALPPRIGLIADLLPGRVEPSMRDALAGAASRLRDAGAGVEEVALPAELQLIWPVADLLDAERAAFLAARPASGGAPGRQRVAGLVPAAYFVQAQRLRTWIAAGVHAVLGDLDALLMPAALGPAPHGLDSTGDSSALVPWSVLGLPAFAVNAGLDESGLPLGLQLVAAARQDASLLRTAAWCEDILGSLPAPLIGGYAGADGALAAAATPRGARSDGR